MTYLELLVLLFVSKKLSVDIPSIREELHTSFNHLVERGYILVLQEGGTALTEAGKQELEWILTKWGIGKPQPGAMD